MLPYNLILLVCLVVSVLGHSLDINGESGNELTHRYVENLLGKQFEELFAESNAHPIETGKSKELYDEYDNDVDGIEEVYNLKELKGAEESVDEFIKNTVQILKDDHKENASIPNTRAEFKQVIGFFIRTVDFTGNQGWLSDLTSLIKKAPSEIEKKDDTVSLGISLSIRDLKFGLNHYSVGMFFITLNGQMNATIDKNSLYVNMTMNFNTDGCKTTVNKIELFNLQNIQVKMTGVGAYEWAYNSGKLYFQQKEFERIISENLTPAFKKALAKQDICTNFPH